MKLSQIGTLFYPVKWLGKGKPFPQKTDDLSWILGIQDGRKELLAEIVS